MTLSGTVTDAMHAGKGGVIVRLADAIPQFAVEAEIDTGVAVPTPVVFTLKVAEVCPVGTVTCAGTCRFALLLCRFTTMPPAGAGAVRVTVPVRALPPVTALTPTLTEATQARTGGLTVTPTDAPPHAPVEAEMVAWVVAETVPMVTSNPAEVCPAPTMI